MGKTLDSFESTCRHGTAYSVIESIFAGIRAQSTYFIPLGQRFEYWRLNLSNESDRARRLSVFTYCEFTNQWITEQDLVNLQYSTFIVKGNLTQDGLLRIAIHDNLRHSQGSDAPMHSWMGLVGAPLSGYDTSRESFLGIYNGYHNPSVVGAGECTNSDAYGDNAYEAIDKVRLIQAGEMKKWRDRVA